MTVPTIEHELVATQEQTCPRYPEQHEGTLKDGRSFYFRYRHGWASLGLGDTVDEAVMDEQTVGTQVGDRGVFESAEERSRVFGKLLAERTAA